MSRRIARQSHRRRNWIFASAAALLALYVACIVYGILPVIVIAVVVAVVFFSARWAGRSSIPATQRRRAAPQRRAATARPVRPPRRRTSPADARARRNGWAPPASTNLREIPISAECATDEHVFCPGAGCACPCGHDPKVIAAINTAKAASTTPAPDDCEAPF